MIVRMSAVLNSNVFDNQCESGHQSHLPVLESSSEFFLTLMMTSARLVKTSVWSTPLFRASPSRHTDDRIHGFKPLTTSRTLILSSSIPSLTGNAIRNWKRNTLIHIMGFKSGLQWQTVYYGIFEYKKNCLKSPRELFCAHLRETTIKG